MSDRQKKTTIGWMVVIIVLCLVGIATRWEFIRSEVATVFGNLFGR